MRKLINFFAFCFFGFVFISCGLTEPDEQKSFLTVTIGTDFISKLYSSETRGIGAENATAPLSYKAELTAVASGYMWTTSSTLTANKSANLVVPSIPANSSVSLTVKVMDSEGDVVYQGSTAVNAGVGQNLALNMNLSYAKDSALDFSLNTSSNYQIFGYYEDEDPEDFYYSEEYLNSDASAEMTLKNKNIVFVFGNRDYSYGDGKYHITPASTTYCVWKLNGVELESHENPLVINLAMETDFLNTDSTISTLICQPVYEYEYEENGEVQSKYDYGDSASYAYIRNFKTNSGAETISTTTDVKEMAFYESSAGGSFWYDFNEDRSYLSAFDTNNTHICAAGKKIYTYYKDNNSSWTITIKEIRKDNFGRLITVDIGTIAEDYMETWDLKKILFDTATDKVWVFLDTQEDNYKIYVSDYTNGVCPNFEEKIGIGISADSTVCTVLGVYNNYIFYTYGFQKSGDEGAECDPGIFGIKDAANTNIPANTYLLDYDTNYSFLNEFPQGTSCAHVTDIQAATVNGTTYVYALISDSYGKYTSGIYHLRGGVARLRFEDNDWKFDKEFGIKGLSDNVEDWAGYDSNNDILNDFKATVPPCENDNGYFYNPLSFCAIKDDYLVILDDGLCKAKDSDPGDFTNKDRIMLFNLKTNEISVQKDVFLSAPSSYIWDTVLR